MKRHARLGALRREAEEGRARTTAPAAPEPAILHLQRTAGNRAVADLLSLQRVDEDEEAAAESPLAAKKRMHEAKAKKAAKRSGLWLLPFRAVDQLSVLDLHIKDAYRFAKTGKTREQRKAVELGHAKGSRFPSTVPNLERKHREGDYRRRAGRSHAALAMAGQRLEGAAMEDTALATWMNPFARARLRGDRHRAEALKLGQVGAPASAAADAPGFRLAIRGRPPVDAAAEGGLRGEGAPDVLASETSSQESSTLDASATEEASSSSEGAAEADVAVEEAAEAASASEHGSSEEDELV